MKSGIVIGKKKIEHYQPDRNLILITLPCFLTNYFGVVEWWNTPSPLSHCLLLVNSFTCRSSHLAQTPKKLAKQGSSWRDNFALIDYNNVHGKL